MRKNGYVHRLIALLMVAVMLLTLAVTNDRSRSAAEEAGGEASGNKTTYEEWEVDLNDYEFKAKSSSKCISEVPTTDKMTSVKVPINSCATFTYKADSKGDTIYLAAVAGGATTMRATSSDALGTTEKVTLTDATKVTQDIKADTDKYIYAVYMACKDASGKVETVAGSAGEEYTVYGIVGYLYLTGQGDTDAPTIGSGTITATGSTSLSKTSVTDYTYTDTRWFRSFVIEGMVAEETDSPVDEAEIVVKNETTGETVTTLKGDGAGGPADNKYSFNYAVIEIKDGKLNETALSDGKYSITYTATNRARNSATEKKIEFKLDTTAPTVALTCGSDTLTTESTYVISAKDGAYLKATINDSNSDVKTKTVTVNDTTHELQDDGTGAYKVEYNFNTSGTYTVKVTAEDNAGNSVEKLYTVVVDNKDLAAKIRVNGVEQTSDSLIYVGGDSVTVTYEVTGFDLTKDDIITKEVTYTDASGEAGTAPEPTLNTSGSGSVKLTYTLSAEGTYAFSFVTRHHHIDATKDSYKAESSLKVVYDKTAPSITTMEFVGGTEAADGVQYYKASETPQIKVEAKDTFALKSYTITTNGGKTLKAAEIKGTSLTQTFDLEGNLLEAGKVYTITFYVDDQAGNSNSQISTQFAIDGEAPTVSITNDRVATGSASLSPYWTNQAVTVNAKASDTFIVSKLTATGTRDGKDVAEQTYTPDSVTKETTTGFTYSAAGAYEITVTAYDGAGNTQTTTCSFIIDKQQPTVQISGIPADGLSDGRTNVTFAINDDVAMDASDFVVTMFYKDYNSDTYTAQTLTVTKSSETKLTASVVCGSDDEEMARSYYFTVSGKDKAGNDVIYDVNTSKFDVDTITPSMTITPSLDENDGYYKKSVSFQIHLTEQFAKTHTITVTDKNKKTNGDSDQTFTLNGTDGTYTVKRTKEGKYNLTILAEDAFGNTAEAEVSFVIDKTAPTIAIASTNKLNNGNVALNVSIADEYKGKEYVVHVVRKNAAGKVVYDGDYKKKTWKTKSVTPAVVFSDEGDYTVTITATDKAGNKKVADTLTFRIDKTAPVLSITGVADSQTTACTATLSVNEAFAFSYDGASLASADVSAVITKKTDGSGTSTIATLNTGSFSSGNPHTTTYTFEDDGEYTITFKAKDMVGNAASTLTKTFIVDKSAPVLTVSAVDSKKSKISEYQVVGGESESSKDYVDMSLEVQETFFASDDVSITVKKDGKDVSSSYFKDYKNNAEVSRGSQRFDEDGVYTVSITAEDAIGNKAEDYEMTFTVDNTAPSLDNTSKMAGFVSRRTSDGDLLLNSEDFADIRDMSYDALWTVNDTSVFQTEVKLDGVDFVDFSDLSDGYHEMTITVTDELGHVSSESFDFTYDGTAPRIIISGVDDKSTVREPFTMSISLEDPEDIITEIVINGETIDPALYESTNTYEYSVEERGKYEVKVTAKDTAGNVSSTYDADTGEVFSFQYGRQLTPFIVIGVILAILVLAAVIFLVAAKRRKKEQE